MSCLESLDDENPCTLDSCENGRVQPDAIIGTPAWNQRAFDVAFFAMGDPQYCGGADNKTEFQSVVMNRFRKTIGSSGFPGQDSTVINPSCLRIAEMPDEPGQFIQEEGLTGNDGLLRYLVY